MLETSPVCFTLFLLLTKVNTDLDSSGNLLILRISAFCLKQSLCFHPLAVMQLSDVISILDILAIMHGTSLGT